MSAPEAYSTFYLGNLLFGLEISTVQEVMCTRRATPVPLAPGELVGLINLRGHTVSVIDLRPRLGSAGGGRRESAKCVVVKTSEGPACLAVDEIGEVVSVSDEDFEPLPENVDPAVRKIVRGVYKLEGRLLHVLDAEKALNEG